MFQRDRPTDPAQRLYAIGDIHGRYDLFRQLIGLIGGDCARRQSTMTRIVLLGDIIDRGPDAAALVRGCMTLTARSDRFTVLKGNHEEMMVQALRGDLDAHRAWLRFGGRETLLSWNVDPAILTENATRNDLRLAANTVGRDVLAWLDHLPLHHRHDDFLFVHAGIRPDIPIAQQDPNDLLWITDDFLTSDQDHGVTVVHGHSVAEDGPDVRSNRIGIDTGAYRTGRLTAIAIEDGQTWYLDTSCDDTSTASRQPCERPVAGAATTAHLAAFDRKLDADLVALLGVTNTLHPETRRRRIAAMRLLLSRRASATIGISLAMLIVAGTATLLHDGVVPPTANVPSPTALSVKAATVAPSAPVQVEVASPDRRAVSMTPRVDRRTRASTMIVSTPDVSMSPAYVEGTIARPAISNQPQPVALRTADLTPDIASPATPAAMTMQIDTSPTIDASAIESPLARSRRDSVTALRALRRQW